MRGAVHGSYLILYAERRGVLVIERVVHGARDLDRLLDEWGLEWDGAATDAARDGVMVGNGWWPPQDRDRGEEPVHSQSAACGAAARGEACARAGRRPFC